MHTDKNLNKIKIRFITMYEKIQKQKKESGPSESSELIFFLEIDTVNLYFQTLYKNLGALALDEPDFNDISEIERKQEVYEIARSQLMEVLNSYENPDLTRLLECISFSND